jgi:outer membrane protein TolC
VKIRWISAPLLACLCVAASAQPASTTPGTVNGADKQLRLDDVVRLALERSPDAASAEHTIRAMTHRVSQARALPDPMVTAGWAGKLAPFDTMAGDASSYRGIAVSEQFPYPGKRRLQGAMAERDVETARADCEAAQRHIVLDVKTAYAEYFYLDKAIEATRQNKELLEKLASIAEAQYRVGKAMQQDVLRAQVEVSMLIEKLTQLEAQRDVATAEINAALVQQPETPLPPPQQLEAQPIRYSLDELYALAKKNDTGIKRDQAAIERNKLSVALAERQFRPDFGVNYMFQQRTNQPDMNGVTVSVNVPIFWKSKQREAVAEAAETLHSTEKMQESQQNTVRAEMRRKYLAAESAQRLLTLYTQGIVPQSSLALESAMSEYQVGKVDFLSLISSFTTLLNYETSYYRQLADHQIAIAQIESLTGEPITTDTATNQPAQSASQEGTR